MNRNTCLCRDRMAFLEKSDTQFRVMKIYDYAKTMPVEETRGEKAAQKMSQVVVENAIQREQDKSVEADIGD